jgi:histidinol-phosphate aminotransferase
MSIDLLIKPGIRNIPPYIPGATAESARRPGITEIFKLASNENQLGTSPKALEALAEAVKTVSIYPDPFCLGLREKIGERFGFTENPGDHVILSSGASGAMLLIGEVFLLPDDEVVTCDPTYGAYNGTSRRNSAKAVTCPLNSDLEYDLDALEKLITEKTKMVYICNPNNPTGTIIDPDKLRAFIHRMPPHLIVVVDEAYIEFSGDEKRYSMISEIKEGVNLIVMRTFSKLYGLAGARIGYSFTNKEIHDVLLKSTSVFVISREAVAAANAALDDDDFVKSTIDMVDNGRKYLTKELTAIGAKVYPSYTNFVYADTGYNTAQLALKCRERGLIIRGNFELSRITVGTEYQNKRVVEIIKEVISTGEVDKVI